MLPYWHDHICVDLLEGRTVLVAAHGNSIRGLIKHLDGLTGEEVVGVEVPTGIPLVYELDERLQKVSSRYLDEEAAARGAAEVANQAKLREADPDDPADKL
jgi:2,3-bisphosphoglycerate-dependent phosphoglycerate mutase